jgi:hypothetical protein
MPTSCGSTALVDAGWADESEFIPGARRSRTFLVATEGSSDAHILKHALALLAPEIEDFFRFIDVTERHPFPGTGTAEVRRGLAKIDVQNQIIFRSTMTQRALIPTNVS